jgi:hypothetical protein
VNRRSFLVGAAVALIPAAAAARGSAAKRARRREADRRYLESLTPEQRAAELRRRDETLAQFRAEEAERCRIAWNDYDNGWWLDFFTPAPRCRRP